MPQWKRKRVKTKERPEKVDIIHMSGEGNSSLSTGGK